MTERRAHIVPRTPVSSVRVLSASPYSRRQTQCASAPVAEPSVVQTVYAVSFRKQLRRTALPVLLTVLLTMAASCSREPVGGGEYGVYVTVSSGTSAGTSGATKGMPDATDNDDYRSIAIFAFTVPDDRLAGYVCHHSISAGQTRFPMTLDGSGTFDFYVILNPNSLNSSDDFFEIADAAGDRVDFPEQNVSSAVIPDAIADLTPADIQSWRVRIREGAESNMGSWDASGNDWYAPMTNLPGSGNTNLRYTIPDTDVITNIPISVTRAVSKVRVWFRTRGDRTEGPQERVAYGPVRWQDNPQTLAPEVAPDAQRRYYSIERMSLSIPVEASGLVSEAIDYYAAADDPFTVENDTRYYYGNTVGESGFPDYDPDDLPDNFYSNEYFWQIWEYYIFPNIYGGNAAGESTGTGTENITVIDVDYAFWQERGSYQYNGRYDYGGYGNMRYTYYYDWTSSFEEETESSGTKTIYLPPVERNTCINVWCALNDDTDRSFTYSVSDWDETVEVDVPDFN